MWALYVNFLNVSIIRQFLECEHHTSISWMWASLCQFFECELHTSIFECEHHTSIFECERHTSIFLNDHVSKFWLIVFQNWTAMHNKILSPHMAVLWLCALQMSTWEWLCLSDCKICCYYVNVHNPAELFIQHYQIPICVQIYKPLLCLSLPSLRCWWSMVLLWY